MSVQDRAADLPEDPTTTAQAPTDEAPENLSAKAWVTLILFAVFIVAAGGCGAAHLLW